MSNIFLTDYYSRLREWNKLRESLNEADTKTICIEVDKFWKKTPLVNHYLHPADIEDWPGPWQLILDNNYCIYARALGIIYTLLLLGIKNIDFYSAIDDNSEIAVLVVVNELIMNWHGETIYDNSLDTFTQLKSIDIQKLEQKLG